MSIASEITRINGNISDAYSACDEKGAILPQRQSSANLADTIGSIPQGSVDAYTKSETNALLRGKAPVITAVTEAYDSDLSELSDLSVDGALTVKARQGTLGHPYLMLSEGANLLPVIISASNTGTVSGVTIEIVDGTSVRLNGTPTANINIYLRSGSNNEISLQSALEQGDDITLGVMCSGTVSSGTTRIVQTLVDGNNTQDSNYFSGVGIYKNTVTARGDCVKAKICIVAASGLTYTNYLITPFMFAGSDVEVTEDPVYTDGYLDISSAVAEYDHLSTYPNQHTVRYAADTKAYVDNKGVDPAEIAQIVDQQFTEKMPEIDSSINTAVNTAVGAKVTYITPEQYGAKGDGSTDDTLALQSCLNAANSRNYVVGAKRYKITSPVRICGGDNSGNNIHVELNRIEYTGNDYAVKIASKWGNIKIHRLESSGSGILIKDDNTSGAVKANSFEFDYIYSAGDSISFESGRADNIAYNLFKVPYLHSSNGNLININAAAVENLFIGGRPECPNGWAIYHSNNMNTFMRFAFETNVKDICCGSAKIVDCRTAEALNYDAGKGREGIFIRLTENTKYTGSEISDYNTPVTFSGVDVSQLDSFAAVMASLNDKIAAQDPDDPQKYFNGCYDVIAYAPGVINNINRYRASGASERLDGRMVIYWNKKAFIPNNDVLEDITTTPFVPLTTVISNPTYFRIGVADCVINLNDSYCPVGIDSFIVEQTNDYKASIYNKDGTLIFDGANLPAGIYKVSCVITPLSASVFNDINIPAEKKELYATRIRYLYTGSNEAWIVTPLS